VVVVFACVATLAAVIGGPDLGDHEALVAQCARDMRVSGDWLVPRYLGEPYVRKPPLPYWLIAGLSYFSPDDAGTDLPVTTTIARLPSAIAALGTVMLLWKLASFMFGHRVGRVTAVVAASSLCILLYAANATVEMILTFCCVWAHTHFWLGVAQPLRSWPRRVHLFLFYVAMGVGMMAKGPLPLVMVGLPIAVWWYCDEALRMLAEKGPACWAAALSDVLLGFGKRTLRAFRELWLIPGLIVFALCFVPWMVAVGARYPRSWDLWNWQYWQRAQGRYEDTRPRNVFYYLPIIPGLVLPWLFLVGEAILAPWIAKYQRERRALLYAGLWALVGTVVMSVMAFKKPYYVTPVIPALLLLIGVVADRFYSSPIRRPKLARAIYLAAVVGGAGAIVGAYFLIRKELPGAVVSLTGLAALAIVLLLLAGLLFLRGRAWTAFGMTAATSVLGFLVAWQICGRTLSNTDKVRALDGVLAKQGVPKTAEVYWVTRRQDARLSFYCGRYTRQMIQPEELVAMFVDRTKHKSGLEELILNRARQLLASPHPVYLVLDRDEYWGAQVAGLRDGVHMIGFAPDEDAEKKDWVVISNTPAK
jgi:4-amino-4-deoxy-L-arabinose transferase-like glycosyltransferase